MLDIKEITLPIEIERIRLWIETQRYRSMLNPEHRVVSALMISDALNIISWNVPKLNVIHG